LCKGSENTVRGVRRENSGEYLEKDEDSRSSSILEKKVAQPE
jgi:hypothetical protein